VVAVFTSDGVAGNSADKGVGKEWVPVVIIRLYQRPSAATRFPVELERLMCLSFPTPSNIDCFGAGTNPTFYIHH